MEINLISADFFNLTMSYRTNSDIYYPFGVFQPICNPEHINWRCNAEEGFLNFRRDIMGCGKLNVFLLRQEYNNDY